MFFASRIASNENLQIPCKSELAYTNVTFLINSERGRRETWKKCIVLRLTLYGRGIGGSFHRSSRGNPCGRRARSRGALILSLSTMLASLFRNKKLISFLFFFLLLFFFFSPSWNRSVTSASRRRTVVTRARLRLPPFDSREKVIVVRGFNEVLSNRPRLARVIISSYTAPRRIVTPTRRCWVRWVCIVSRKRGEKSCTPPPVRIRSILAVQPPFFFPRSV